MTQEAKKKHVREKKDSLPPPDWGFLHQDIGRALTSSIQEVLKLDYDPMINLSNFMQYVEPQPTPHYFLIDEDTRRHYPEAHYSPEDQVRIVRAYLERTKKNKPDLISETQSDSILALFAAKRNLKL
ncbi:hypothetical protein K2P56_01325 [Patescibacteria group bacterium]|nr:hypothetical protein [Patescibacteria group bacterium]